MISLLTIFGALVALYVISFPLKLARNYLLARKTGLPIIIVPIDQNHLLWMVACVPLRTTFKKYLPGWIYERLDLCIYGWEFRHGLKPFQKYGKPGNDKTFFLVTCGQAEISTCDPELAWEIARRPRDFQIPDTTALIMGQFGRNVLTDNGEQWAKQRKVVAGVINERISKTVFSESIRQTEGLLSEVYEKADGNVSDTNRLFDMMKKISINVLSGAGMGASVAWNGNDDEKPREGYKLTYIEACKTVIDAVAGPIILPVWLMKNWPWFLPGHQFLQDLAPAMVEFPLHIKHLLEQERQRSTLHGGQTQSNIMSQLLQASEQEGSKALTEEEMIGNLFIFTGAGFDTTANTLAYALVLLGRYPKWQNWVLEEVDNLLPTSSSEPVDYASIFPKVVRIMAVMLETLRIFVPVIHIARSTRTPQVIQTSTRLYHVPADCFTYIDSIALHLDKTLWRDLNQPESNDNGNEKKDLDPTATKPDEQTFRPTRWVNPPSSPQPLFQPPRGAYIPWSTGPRVCPGQKMAQVEFTAILLTLFRRHRIEIVPLMKKDVGVDGKEREETREEVNSRLDALMRDSISVLTLQMVGVYDVGVGGDGEGGAKGLQVRFSRRR